ncbi:Piso0_002998 [Millerozyma farinosa CBS 7064]|uniref:Piso0_002998 protein n=1 Tax=Pichia sorbitophila (strain ATCC MYA-4447 / BCRC 22081 / CBS 7064 / NBRC 10061 / NRRL Y-12695) TaxID=559304 RepID=G8YGW9_PICSO|nr:Piso0_002998 [Millerozyma farinosa CBS 7064]CCE80671.1 Piso0_002998 [Millerozyma farinosa CBS 7064]
MGFLRRSTVLLLSRVSAPRLNRSLCSRLCLPRFYCSCCVLSPQVALTFPCHGAEHRAKILPYETCTNFRNYMTSGIESLGPHWRCSVPSSTSLAHTSDALSTLFQPHLSSQTSILCSAALRSYRYVCAAAAPSIRYSQMD